MIFKKHKLLALVAFFLSIANLNAQQADSATYFVVDNIYLIGNKVTRPHIIYRELLVKTGDSLSRQELENLLDRSRQNVLNTGLFYFAAFTKTIKQNQHIDLNLQLSEAWYTWPVPIFELVDRNFNVWLQSKDFSRINYGFYLTRYNFRGRKETLDLAFRSGYTHQLGFSYSIPYLDAKQKHGLSFTISNHKAKEVAYSTINNKLRFYSTPESFVRNAWTAGLRYTYRPNIYKYFSAAMFYNSLDVRDKVLSLNPEFSYGGKNLLYYSTLSLEYRNDNRDIRFYPLSGNYLEAGTSLRLVNNAELVPYVNASYRRYYKITKQHYASWSLSERNLLNAKVPFAIQSALGYNNDLVRGYEYYVIQYLHAAILKLQYKYALFPTRPVRIALLKKTKLERMPMALYLNAFSDAAYSVNKKTNNGNTLENSLLYGAGVGADFVIYYQMVLRLEYSINRMGEGGFFLHFNVPL